MQNQNDELNIDDILAEFGRISQSADLNPEEKKNTAAGSEDILTDEGPESFAEQEDSDIKIAVPGSDSVKSGHPDKSSTENEQRNGLLPGQSSENFILQAPIGKNVEHRKEKEDREERIEQRERTDTWHNPFDPDATSVWQPAEDRITHYADRYRNLEANKRNSSKKLKISSDFVRNIGNSLKNNTKLQNQANLENSENGSFKAERKEMSRSAPEKSKRKPPENGSVHSSVLRKNAADQLKNISKKIKTAETGLNKVKKQKKERPEREPLLASVSDSVINVTGILLTVLCLLFVLIFVNPAAGSSSTTVKKEEKTNDLTAPLTALTLSSAAEIHAAEATPEPTPVPVPEKVHYTIPETDLVAPAPDSACYGSVMPDSAAEIDTVIQRARAYGLLGESETTVFHSDASFRTDTAIRYYLDETLLVICWKELIDGNTCSCAEVKVADASQFRRKFADDAFGSSNSYYATDLAKSVNAVAAMNADYYLFRDFGIVVYNRELYRFNDGTYSGSYKKYNCVDTCFITETGDIQYFRKGQETTEEELRQFIADQGIVFSIAFGPILVENGEAVYTDSYPVGEIDKGYSRAGFGQVDTLHYFYMNLNHSDEKQARWDINTFAQHFAEKGVRTGYAFDGGQTGELVFQGEPYNYIDFGAERLVSDIIYFATALPGEGAVS